MPVYLNACPVYWECSNYAAGSKTVAPYVTSHLNEVTWGDGSGNTDALIGTELLPHKGITAFGTFAVVFPDVTRSTFVLGFADNGAFTDGPSNTNAYSVDVTYD